MGFFWDFFGILSQTFWENPMALGFFSSDGKSHKKATSAHNTLKWVRNFLFTTTSGDLSSGQSAHEFCVHPEECSTRPQPHWLTFSLTAIGWNFESSSPHLWRNPLQTKGPFLNQLIATTVTYNRLFTAQFAIIFHEKYPNLLRNSFGALSDGQKVVNKTKVVNKQGWTVIWFILNTIIL